MQQISTKYKTRYDLVEKAIYWDGPRSAGAVEYTECISAEG